MKTETAYCSGCGHQVRLVLTDGPPRDGQANLPDGAEVVANQLVEPVALAAVDRHRGFGHGASPLGRAPKAAATPPSNDFGE